MDILDHDAVVIGGGPAGVSAAISAAKEGLDVLLVEKCGFLGGNLTSGLVGTIGGLYVRDGDSIEYCVGGLPLECAETLKGRGLAYGPVPWEKTAVLPHVPWGLKKLFDEWVEGKHNLRLLLHTALVDVDLENGVIQRVALHTRSGKTFAKARVFIDASGDGDLALLAGAVTEDSPVQFPTMNFYMHNVNVVEALTAGLATLQSLIREAIETGEYDLPRAGGAVIPTMRPGEVIVAMGRIALEGRPVDCTNPAELTYAEMEGRKQAVVISEFLKAKMPGFSEAYLADTPCRVGIRSTRRLVGEYVLTEEDVLGASDFPDGICRSSWPVELHLEGKDTILKFPPPGKTYAVPYRCLVTRKISNLIAAGRFLSATVEGQASSRVSATCMGMGEAAGIAAALVAQSGASAVDVDVEALRGKLKERGAVL